MSFDITYKTEKYGTRRASVALKCGYCGHTGTATFYKEPQMHNWGRGDLIENADGRGEFSQSELAPYIGDTYCTCVGEAVFEASRLSK